MSDLVTLIIDGKEIRAPKGEKLLWVALDNDIYIPHLCGLRDAERPAASCRLCFVEVEGMPNPVTSCTLPVKDGMVVYTRTPRVDRLVKTGFELLLTNHRLQCGKCEKNKNCELQEIAKKRGLKLKLTRMRPLATEFFVDESPRTFKYDPGRCVLCGRCVWVDHHRVKIGAIGFINRGVLRKVATFGDVPLADSRCTECGECVKVCPVGALVFKA
ncbi:MAG: 2Fe-2S iron-sulfur cluster-binding protein [Thermacetogeniaceae bacterium]